MGGGCPLIDLCPIPARISFTLSFHVIESGLSPDRISYLTLHVPTLFYLVSKTNVQPRLQMN